MQTDIPNEAILNLEETFQAARSFDTRTSIAFDMVKNLGFDSLIYDYSPVAVAHDGGLMTPSYVCMKNVPEEMPGLWCEGGFYQIDPVQKRALDTTTPFVWSYSENKSNSVFGRYITNDHMELVSYLQDANLTLGVTVPIQSIEGDLATFTAISHRPGGGFERDALEVLAKFSMIGHVFHQHAYPQIPERERCGTFFKLSPRECEVLRHAADGLSAKQTAYQLNRSVATISQHLQSAAVKLGAKNRVHAVVLARHYRLLQN